MAQRQSLILTLKQCLKRHGIHYADVAQHLNLSEASVKRLFAEQNFSLDRLERVCHLVDMEISDLVREMEVSAPQITQLSTQQEHEIVEELPLLLVTVCVFSYYTMDDIMTRFSLSEADCVKQLLRLEKMGLIDVMPGNRIKLRTSKAFRWQENGPFETFFRHQVGREFFEKHFDKPHHYLRAMNVSLPKETIAAFQKKGDALMRELVTLSRDSADIDTSEKESLTIVLAMRDWDYGLFKPMTHKEI